MMAVLALVSTWEAMCQTGRARQGRSDTLRDACIRSAVRRARILKEGQLTMIMYGADEALKWQMRVSMFLQAARYETFHLHVHAKKDACSISRKCTISQPLENYHVCAGVFLGTGGASLVSGRALCWTVLLEFS